MATLGLLTTLALAGCTAGQPEQSPATDQLFTQVMADTQKMVAADPQVGDEQRGLLDAAAERGEVTLDDLATALRGNANCLEDAGFETGGVTIDGDSFPPSAHLERITAPADMLDNQAMALINDCDARYYKYVSRVYTFQPQAQDAYWARADELAPAIRQCLKQHEVPDDLIGETTAEIVNAALKLKDLYGDFSSFTRADCMQGLSDPTANR